MKSISVKQLIALLSTCNPNARIELEVEGYVYSEIKTLYGETKFDIREDEDIVYITAEER